ncbi:uncharacterized protein LOC135396748 [Ornithodoros turicata]|uniref:uncharacterized protein LOC135396748 n=1 Tax=Ornithodoros turicata TaxID=34597 RepID=UPI00313A03C2
MAHHFREQTHVLTDGAGTRLDMRSPSPDRVTSVYAPRSTARGYGLQLSSHTHGVHYSDPPARLSQPSSWEPSEPRYGTPQHALEDQESHHLLKTLLEKISTLESRFKAFESRIFLHNKETLLEIREMNKRCVHGKVPLNLPEDCLIIPATAFEMLEDLDTYLQKERNLTSMVNFFATKGGSEERGAVRTVQRDIVSNQLALRCSWKGSQGEKHSFSKLTNVIKMILGSVRINFKDATDATIKNVVKKWLYCAADRNGGRSQRRKQASNQ